MFDPTLATQHLENLYGNMPHPLAPEIRVKDYPAYARAATVMKGELPNGDDVRSTHHVLRSANLSPADFEYLWQLALPVATRFFGKNRKPQVQELVRLKNAGPNEVYQYYASLPHPQYPEARIGDMFRYYHATLPIAREHTGQEPSSLELARFATARYDIDSIHRYFHEHSGST